VTLSVVATPEKLQALAKTLIKSRRTLKRKPVVGSRALDRLGSANSSLPTAPSSLVDEAGASLLDAVDPKLLELSKTLTHREPLGSKPRPIGKPEVWADSRQSLCETVPYFQKPQGGCHQNTGHVYAFLYDGVGQSREYIDSDLIIARAGGSMVSDGNRCVQGKDHEWKESQVQAVLNDIQLQNPLIIICGDKNTGAQCEMPHKYNVLGWYKPVMVWAEKTTGKGGANWTTIKYRLERLAMSEPWHAPSAAPVEHNETPAAGGALIVQACSDCQQSHPQIYLECWTCLNPSCDRFWKLPDGEDAPSGDLTYKPAFLLCRSPWANEELPYSVVPRLPDLGKAIGDNLTYLNTRGVVCPECGRCNQRYVFRGWRCDAPGCSWPGFWPRHQPIVPSALHAPWGSYGYGPALGRNAHVETVGVTVQYTHNYKVYRYTFAGIVGSFVHAVANNRVKEEPRGPNDMLAELQLTDMGLERRRFNCEKMSTIKPVKVVATPSCDTVSSRQLPTPPAEPDVKQPQESLDTTAVEEALAPTKPVEQGDFMTAFSMNYGMPYKFVASGCTRSFDDARTPWPIRECRSRLHWAAKAFLPSRSEPHDEPPGFNEELVFAYMQGQKLDYHDDGEAGLGATIAALSLGGTARMQLRMKAKHFFGCSKLGLLTPDRPVAGSVQYAERLRLWEELQALKETDKVAYQRRIREIPKELGVYEKRSSKVEDLVTVTLGHGDVVIMEGDEIQKYLEHRVVSEGHLRFALTCRTVLGHHLKEHERPEYEVGPDTIGYDGSGLR
ncbi:hypothetical protein LTR53_017627, partial [Teratosphaeriaceae sp. CCFEE 6253]